MKTDTKQKLIDVTAQACSVIYEQLPENEYIVAIFDVNEKSLRNTFRGKMSKATLIALMEAAADALAEETKAPREVVYAALLAHKGVIENCESL